MNGIKTEKEYMETKRQAEAMRDYLADLQSDSPSAPVPLRFSEPKWWVIYLRGTQEQLNNLHEAIHLYEMRRTRD